MQSEELRIIHQRRDCKIINQFSTYIPEFEQRFSPDVLEALKADRSSSYEAAWMLAGEVAIPIVFTRDPSQTRNKIYADPATSGQMVPIWEAFIEWEIFQEHLLKEKLIGQDGQAWQVIARVLNIFRKDHTPRETQLFVERLWRHRWIYDATSCANWLLAGFVTDPKDLLRIVAEGHEGDRVFHEVELRLKQAKENAINLDDWFEQLYLLFPLVRYARLLYSTPRSEDEKKRQRWLDEVIADVDTIYMIGIFGLRGLEPKRQYYWEVPQQGENPLREALRRLSFGYHARVMYPMFWFEAVKKYLEAGIPLPLSLGKFNPQRLMSIFITSGPRAAKEVLTPSLEFSRGLMVELFRDPSKPKSTQLFAPLERTDLEPGFSWLREVFPDRFFEGQDEEGDPYFVILDPNDPPKQ